MDEIGSSTRVSAPTPGQVLGCVLALGGVGIAVAGGVAGLAAFAGWGLTLVGLFLAIRTQSAVVRTGGAFIISLVVVGVLGRMLRVPEEPKTAASQDDPSVPALRAATPWTLFKVDDGATAQYVQLSRSIIVAGEVDEQQLRDLLRSVYVGLRREALAATPRSKKVFVYAYPTEARAEAGGEWIGMIGEVGDGDLPVEPEIQTRLGSAESPTAVEEAIYDDLKKQLAAAAMRDPDFDESAVMQAVASEHNVTVDELDAVQIKVMVYRHGR